MGNKFSSGKFAIAECDRCGQRFKLKQLKKLVVKQQIKNILVCPECWEPDQPQLSLGLYPVDDPQAVRNPRPDTSYLASGVSGLQILAGNNTALMRMVTKKAVVEYFNGVGTLLVGQVSLILF